MIDVNINMLLYYGVDDALMWKDMDTIYLHINTKHMMIGLWNKKNLNLKDIIDTNIVLKVPAWRAFSKNLKVHKGLAKYHTKILYTKGHIIKFYHVAIFYPQQFFTMRMF